MAAALAGAALLAGAADRLAAEPLEISTTKAQAMLIREDLASGIVLFRAPSDLDYWTATNTVVVINDEDVTVFDSCTRAVTARAVIAEIRKLTSKPVRTLINSHWHQDHWSGNDEYRKAFPDVRIVASEETRRYMSHMGAPFFAGELGVAAMRKRLADAVASGHLPDGSALTVEERARRERVIAQTEQFEAEVRATPRVLPNLTYRDEMTLWQGSREVRLLSLTGDATASTVLYLPREKVLVTGDVLVSPENGKGPPPWSTNSYAITPWLESLRRLAALDVDVIVPGQGPAMHDKVYLLRTIHLFESVLQQVHAALDRGLFRLKDVQAAVDLDGIGREYAPGVPLDDDWRQVVGDLAMKATQEATDGAIHGN